MGVGSGIGGSAGVSEETVFGTYVAPARWPEVDNFQVKKVKNTAQADGLAAGRYVELGSQRVVTTRAAAGDYNQVVLNKGFGLILRHLMGGTAVPVQQAATAAYLQTHILADNLGKSLTWQTGIPDTTGSAPKPYTFLGCKIMAAEFSCGIDNNLTVKVTLDSQDVVESQSLAAPSVVTGTMPFHFGQMGVKIGTFGSEAAIGGIRKVTIKLARPQKTDRFYANAAGLKGEPIWNARFNITGTIEQDFVDKTTLADKFAADSSTSLVWEFIGPIIASTYAQTFRIRVPMIFLDGDTQTLDGQDVQTQSYPIVGKFDGTNAPATCEYMSTDTAV